MSLTTKKVLITVKTYPNPSKKYGETVCCAGIDLDTGEWIRLYPIPFRDLDSYKKFKKYSIISVKCHKAASDKRTESYKVDSDSIEIIDHFDTKQNWQKRKTIMLPTCSKSFCEILQSVEVNKSLGMFKPVNVSFSWKKAIVKDTTKRDACYAQMSLFDKKKTSIEAIPFDFYYSFQCDNHSGCPGHKLPIMDWEISQSYRSWRYRYSSESELLEMIKNRWLSSMCSDGNDVYFYVGNMQRFKNQFMVLGVLYPKK